MGKKGRRNKEEEMEIHTAEVAPASPLVPVLFFYSPPPFPATVRHVSVYFGEQKPVIFIYAIFNEPEKLVSL